MSRVTAFMVLLTSSKVSWQNVQQALNKIVVINGLHFITREHSCLDQHDPHMLFIICEYFSAEGLCPAKSSFHPCLTNVNKITDDKTH